MKRKIEDDLVKETAAKEILGAIQPLDWFVQAAKTGNASAMRDEAPFISLSTAERLIERANEINISSAYQSLRSYAQKYLQAQEDAKWGGRWV
jgi:hypothetical protein